MIYDLVRQTRSYRRFRQNEPVTREQLVNLVDLARLSASAANLQPLKFLLSCDAEQNAAIFPFLTFAAYLKDWDGPAEGERPGAYVIILGDKEIADNFGLNHGIAAQSIVLGATEMGLGGCIIGNIQRERLRAQLRLPGKYEILLVVALGVPNETIVLEEAVDGNTRYYRDAEDIYHVPKRPLTELILEMSL